MPYLSTKPNWHGNKLTDEEYVFSPLNIWHCHLLATWMYYYKKTAPSTMAPENFM